MRERERALDTDMVTNLGREVLWLSLKLAAPMLLVGMSVGILFAIFQAVTSVQEQTMTLIPKMIAVIATSAILLPWILRTLTDFTVRLLSRMAEIPG